MRPRTIGTFVCLFAFATASAPAAGYAWADPDCNPGTLLNWFRDGPARRTPRECWEEAQPDPEIAWDENGLRVYVEGAGTFVLLPDPPPDAVPHVHVVVFGEDCTAGVFVAGGIERCR